MTSIFPSTLCVYVACVCVCVCVCVWVCCSSWKQEFVRAGGPSPLFITTGEKTNKWALCNKVSISKNRLCLSLDESETKGAASIWKIVEAPPPPCLSRPPPAITCIFASINEIRVLILFCWLLSNDILHTIHAPCWCLSDENKGKKWRFSGYHRVNIGSYFLFCSVAANFITIRFGWNSPPSAISLYFSISLFIYLQLALIHLLNFMPNRQLYCDLSSAGAAMMNDQSPLVHSHSNFLFQIRFPLTFEIKNIHFYWKNFRKQLWRSFDLIWLIWFVGFSFSLLNKNSWLAWDIFRAILWTGGLRAGRVADSPQLGEGVGWRAIASYMIWLAN